MGRTYGNYEFVDVLDSSRDSVTYKVKNKLANRLEVLKVLPKSSQDDQERLERFLREIRVHAGLLHPNIVTFYNATELEGQIVMTSELVEGVTLAERLKLGPLPWADAVTFISQVLSALACAHGRGVVHRDITPDHIILTPEGTARMGGFGMAKPVADHNVTHIGAAIGSVKYISPEQVKGIQQADARSDIYSAGIVLYEAMTGKPPFDSKSQFEVMAAHVNTVPLAPSSANPKVPRQLDAVVAKTLAKEPAHRFQTAAEFRQALESARSAVLAPQPAPAVSAPAPRAPAPQVPSPQPPAAQASAAPPVAAKPAVTAPPAAAPPAVAPPAPVPPAPVPPAVAPPPTAQPAAAAQSAAAPPPVATPPAAPPLAAAEPATPPQSAAPPAAAPPPVATPSVAPPAPVPPSVTPPAAAQSAAAPPPIATPPAAQPAAAPSSVTPPAVAPPPAVVAPAAVAGTVAAPAVTTAPAPPAVEPPAAATASTPTPAAPPVEGLEGVPSEPLFAPLSAAPIPREMMLAGFFLFVTGIVVFFAFR